VLSQIAIEDHHRPSGWYQEAVEAKDETLRGLKKHVGEATDLSKQALGTIVKSTKGALDEAFELAEKTADTAGSKYHDATASIESWLQTEGDELYSSFDGPHDDPPHHGPPHHDPDHDHPPPHHGHGPPNQTIYQLISESKYTTKLAKLINKYDDL
ncbi:hypothetical protein LTR53_019404, partial [Teratosphaeriaceae sp. CCFEE 6253]